MTRFDQTQLRPKVGPGTYDPDYQTVKEKRIKNVFLWFCLFLHIKKSLVDWFVEGAWLFDVFVGFVVLGETFFESVLERMERLRVFYFADVFRNFWLVFLWRNFFGGLRGGRFSIDELRVEFLSF